jgi:D-alanine-D-alanine ligase-like ATP-grasp enzyme
MSVLYTKEGLKLRKEDFYSIYDKNGVVIDHKKRVINYKGKELPYTKLNKTYINEKSIVKKILLENGIPTSNYYMWKRNESDSDNLNNLFLMKRPLVIKPDIGQQGYNVSTNVMSDSHIIEKVHTLLTMGKDVLIEEQVENYKEYRVTVLNGEVIGATEKTTATIRGDGINTITQLIEKFNTGKEYKIHTVDYAYIKQQGYEKEDIVPNGVKVILTNVANMSNGSSVKEVDLNKIHPMNKLLFKQINEVLNYTITGIDYLGDLEVPYTLMGSVIEVNPAPGIEIHSNIVSDKKLFVMSIIDNLYRHQ